MIQRGKPPSLIQNHRKKMSKQMLFVFKLRLLASLLQVSVTDAALHCFKREPNKDSTNYKSTIEPLIKEAGHDLQRSEHLAMAICTMAKSTSNRPPLLAPCLVKGKSFAGRAQIFCYLIDTSLHSGRVGLLKVKRMLGHEILPGRQDSAD